MCGLKIIKKCEFDGLIKEIDNFEFNKNENGEKKLTRLEKYLGSIFRHKNMAYDAIIVDDDVLFVKLMHDHYDECFEMSIEIAINNSIKCFKSLFELSLLRPVGVSENVGRFGGLEMLKIAVDKCGWNADVLYKVIIGGNVECLEFLLDYIKIEIEEFVRCPAYCSLAAGLGRINVLKCLRRYGFVWDENACFAAVRSDLLECLKYLHENGCDYDRSSIKREACVNCSEYINTYM